MDARARREGAPLTTRGPALALDDAIAQAISAWPGLHVDRAAFAAFLAERLDGAEGSIRAADLYLAFACLAGDGEALRRFEHDHLAPIPAHLERVDIPRAIAGEVPGVLRERLLVGDGAPRLREYRGRGDLRGWLRVAAVRTALDLMRRQAREVPLEPSLADAIADEGDDPELAHLKQHYAAEFKAAFEEALLALTPRERNLLRHQTLHGLGVDQIGAIYRVHRATAARWVDAARTRLASEVRGRLMARLRADRANVESILRLIQSQIDVSVRRCLRDREE